MASWSQIARRIRVLLGFVFAVIYFWLAQPSGVAIITGACIATLGLTIRALASGHVRKNEQLVTSGPYGYLRNPLYLGSMVIAAGFALAARSWWVVIGMTIIFFAIYLPVIRSEEEFLTERFPEFQEYAHHVPRFLPRLSAFGNVPGSFSWQLYWKHREYNAMLGAGLMMLALAAKLWWCSR